ncbi:hypothetical protein [Actinomadura roseirufa]|uniref:hypothetical protein n=1 Tax=Actinomadura roseirufa TaxID=2094049 RepID=UPI001041AD78|nr:hypothetical protein [Actinomadura roseirufa]
MADRAYRFGDWSQVRDFCQSGRPEGERPFYSGAHVGDRMHEVRRAINEIRVGWDRYDDFRDGLRAQLPADVAVDDPEERRIHDLGMAALFSRTLEWADRREPGDHDDGALIRYYTSEIGYRQIFGAINRAFRSDGLTADPAALRDAAFLIELLSIDLFNYRDAADGADDFHGTVYRGMCLPAESFERLRRVAASPVRDRYLSVPLAMVSTSLEPERAAEFASREAERRPGAHPVLWRIEVAGLPAELLEIYRAAFPAGVVTSLCAVPIEGLSYFSHEREVLLRGPFFQILAVDEEPVPGSLEPLSVVDALMLNSNRDHVTTVASNEGDDLRARDLFRRLVTLHRSDLCAERAAARGSAEDAAAYRAIAGENLRGLPSTR